MSKEKLPILISIPHGGTKIPAEIQTNCILTEKEILLDSDTWTQHLYDFKGLVEEIHQMDIARIFIDVNRQMSDVPPENPDGVVKTLTVAGEKVWSTENGLSELEREKLIQTYYLPYHQELEAAAENPNVVLAIDCHSMLDYGPKSGSSWEHRPLFCIGNRGNTNGAQEEESITASEELMTSLKEALEKKFASYQEEAKDEPLVSMNVPFRGGHVTQYHGRLGKIPWIQLEVNRKLYLPKSSLLTLEPSDLELVKMAEFRDMLYEVLAEVVKSIHRSSGKTAL